jgi:lysine N6-hydroxylase
LHNEKQQLFNIDTSAVILATGYKYEQPSFLEPIKEFFTLNEDGKYQVNKNYSIDKIGTEVFVQNAELHTHGFNSADLGMGAYRNSVILNSILGYEEFSVESNIAFQTFGVPM